MDELYNHLYEAIYRHFYNYCFSGNEQSKDAISQLKVEIEKAADDDLTNIFQIVDSVHPNDISKFKQKSDEYEKSLEAEEYKKIWRFYRLIHLAYKYIYPEHRLSEQRKQAMKDAHKKLTKLEFPDFEYFEFDYADYEIGNHIDKETAVDIAYEDSFEKRDFRLKKRSFLMILKGFSSSTPFFYSALREWFHNMPIKGGGLFLKWNRYGVAIDPGINFMENMHMNGLNIKDINAIIVTHNHIDHNGDLLTID